MIDDCYRCSERLREISEELDRGETDLSIHEAVGVLRNGGLAALVYCEAGVGSPLLHHRCRHTPLARLKQARKGMERKMPLSICLKPAPVQHQAETRDLRGIVPESARPMYYEC